MSKINFLLEHYGESHQNATNKLVHWVCVPTIVFSVLGLFYSIPFPIEKTWLLNWAGVFMAACMVYYFVLSVPLALGMAFVSAAMLFGNHAIAQSVGGSASGHLKIVGTAFVAAWIVQFIGHKIEGKKPSFLEDVQYLMIGPVWLLSFIYQKIGVRYS